MRMRDSTSETLNSKAMDDHFVCDTHIQADSRRKGGMKETEDKRKERVYYGVNFFASFFVCVFLIFSCQIKTNFQI